jgi:hypothetical protein
VSDDKILVRVSEDVSRAQDYRTGKVREIPVEDLTKNVNQFLAKIERMIRDTPAVVADFAFVELEISAEVSAEGKLSVMGTGVGVTAQGGLTFRFQRQSSQKSEP